MKQLWEGLFTKNPVIVLALGLVPAVAVTSTAKNGLALGVLTTIILVIGSMVSWLFVPRVPVNAKQPVRLIVRIAVVAVAYSLLLANNPGLVASLGIFLPLIAFSDLLSFHEEDEGLAKVVSNALGRGLGFALVLVILGIIREFLGFGSVFGRQLVFGSLAPLSLASSVPGGMIILGLLMALVNLVTKRGGELHD